jgi:hypothetical protein
MPIVILYAILPAAFSEINKHVSNVNNGEMHRLKCAISMLLSRHPVEVCSRIHLELFTVDCVAKSLFKIKSF